MLEFLFCLCLIAWAEDIVPGRMIDVRSAGGGVLELHASLGTPPRDVRLGANMLLDRLVLSRSPLDSSFSATLTPIGYTDLLHVANSHLMLPINVDYATVAEFCPSCDGILGLGGNSPFWVFWRSVRISLSGIRLEEDPLTEGARCSQPDPNFCNTTGTVHVDGYEQDVRVLFSLDEPVTRLPIQVFRMLRGGRNLREAWPDLRIVLDGTGPNHARTILIPSHQIVRDVTGEPETLTVRQQNTNRSVVTIGQDALRALYLRRDFNKGLIQTFERISERNLSVLQTVGLVILWPLFFYWKLVKPIFRLTNVFMARHPVMSILHILIDALTAVLPFLFFFQRGTWRALAEDPWMTVVLGIAAVFAGVWLTLSISNLLLRGSEYHGIFGKEFAKFDRRSQPVSARYEVGHDAEAAQLDRGTRYRIARSLIVHQWARDVNILVTIWLILLAISPDTLRSMGYFITYFFLFVTTAGTLLLAWAFSKTQLSVLWLGWCASALTVCALFVVFFSVRVLGPVGELVHNLFEIESGFFITTVTLIFVIVTIQVERGRARTLEIWVQQTAARKNQ